MKDLITFKGKEKKFIDVYMYYNNYVTQQATNKTIKYYIVFFFIRVHV